MANQITIDIGAAANDGTGDPLRTAFNDVNLNFANVWNTGLPNSNIQFSDNRLLTVNTNANLILAPNGTGVVQANVDILPSINRVQNLGSLTKKWNTVNAYYINADVANVASFGNLTIDVANLHITGGSNGYVLQTDGAGNLTWTAQTGGGGGGTPGGANGQIQFNDAGNFGGHVGFTFNSVTHLITVPGNIIPGGNATQALGNSTHQWKDLWVSNNTIYMNSVPISLTTGNTLTVNGADVVTVSNNANATANIGNFVFNANSLQNLNGGSFNNGDLTHGSTSGLNIAPNGSGAAEFYNTYGNVLVETGSSGTVTNTWKFDRNGNITLPSNTSSINYANGAPYGGSTGTGIVGFDQYNIYNTQGGGLILSNFNYLTAEAETAYVNIPAGDSVGDLQIVQEKGNITLNANSSQTWSFNSDSSFKLPNNSNIVIVDNTITQINAVATANSAINLRAFDNNGNTTASSFFDGTDGTLTFYSYNPAIDTSYNWRFDNGGSFTLPNAPGNVYFGEGANEPVIIPGATAMTLNANRADATQDYITVSQDGIELFSVNTINIDNSTTGLLNTDINIRSGDDIFLRGRNKPDDSEAEGGDLFIWAGQGANSTQTGFDTNSGGDIQIYGGAGGLAQGATTFGGSGGTIDISAGDGGTSLDSLVGSGGWINLTAGSAATPVDSANGGFGGSVSITAGATTRVNESGGSISLNTGGSTGGGYGAAGAVEINIPESNVGPGGTWTFTGTGKTLQVPADSEIYGANFGNFTVGCAGNTIVTSSDYGANVKNWVFGYTGNLLAPGNIITPTNFVGTSLRTNLNNFNWSANITNIITGATTVINLANNIFGDPWDGQITITDVAGATEANATWWYQATDSNSLQLYTDNTFTTPVDSSAWGAYTGGGFAVTIDYGNIQINAQTVTIQSGQADYNNRTWEFTSSGYTLFPVLNTPRGDVSGGTLTGDTIKIGDGSNQAIISTPDAGTGEYSSQRLVINPGKGEDGTAGEGGDIYLWAGRGGSANGNGGDVKIRGGYGPGDGQGGYIRMEGGEVQGTGAAGYIELLGGTAGGAAGGYISLTGGPGATVGGNISIQGGYGSGNVGGDVTITGGGSGQGLASYGNVGISAGASSWAFDNTGTLTFPSLANISGGNFNAGTASATVALNAFSPDGNTVSIQAQGNTTSAVISIFANSGPVTNDWVFTHATLDPTEPLFYVPGGAAIVTPEATGGAGGKNIFIEAGAADQQTYNTSAGGDLMLKGGRGAFNDGGGGGPGGDVNINAGESADPAGVAGNVYITAGALQNWTFDNTGTLTAPGAITAAGTVSGQTLVATQSAPNEGGEIQLALPSSGTTLTGNIIIDSYQNSIRFFESNNSRGLFVDVPNVSVSGQYAIGYRDVPQIALSGNVTANSITAGKHFYSTTAGNLQVTIPDNANVAFPLGATLTIVMNAAGNVIVAQGTGVSLYMAGSSTTGNRTVGAYGLASVMKVATDTWVISGTGVY